MSWGVLCNQSMATWGRWFQARSLSRVWFTLHCFPTNSELEKDGHTALNTHSVSPLEKMKQYQTGQTVTCFLKKVSNAHLAMRPIHFSEENEKLETRAVSTRRWFCVSYNADLWKAIYKASAPRKLLV